MCPPPPPQRRATQFPPQGPARSKQMALRQAPPRPLPGSDEDDFQGWATSPPRRRTGAVDTISRGKQKRRYPRAAADHCPTAAGARALPLCPTLQKSSLTKSLSLWKWKLEKRGNFTGNPMSGRAAGKGQSPSLCDTPARLLVGKPPSEPHTATQLQPFPGAATI